MEDLAARVLDSAFADPARLFSPAGMRAVQHRLRSLEARARHVPTDRRSAADVCAWLATQLEDDSLVARAGGSMPYGHSSMAMATATGGHTPLVSKRGRTRVHTRARAHVRRHARFVSGEGMRTCVSARAGTWRDARTSTRHAATERRATRTPCTSPRRGRPPRPPHVRAAAPRPCGRPRRPPLRQHKRRRARVRMLARAHGPRARPGRMSPSQAAPPQAHARSGPIRTDGRAAQPQPACAQ